MAASAVAKPSRLTFFTQGDISQAFVFLPLRKVAVSFVQPSQFLFDARRLPALQRPLPH
jgi:hypothetical protein